MAAEMEMDEQVEVAAELEMNDGVFSRVNHDILLNILGRLPAVSFASAACVDKTWNKNCNRILSRPKFASALSLNPDLHDALNEALAEALSKPIRPDFVIACIGQNFCLKETHKLITQKLGAGIPIITTIAEGLIGPDVETDELTEVNWRSSFDDVSEWNENTSNRGIVLSVGYVPGVKVDVIPLLRPHNENCLDWKLFANHESQFTLADHFVTEIVDYTLSVSGSKTPSCIIMFGDRNVDMQPILTKLDYFIAKKTAIVGDASATFMCTRRDESQNYSRDLFYFAAAALVFAPDKNKPAGIGETEFHIALSPGLIPFGPHIRTLSVFERRAIGSLICAVIIGYEGAILDYDIILAELIDKLETPDIYIGVTQRRQYYSMVAQPLSFVTSLSFHEVKGGEHDFIKVDGVGIKPGDIFFFYHADAENALITIDSAIENFGTLVGGGDDKVKGREVFGGFIFSSSNRGESFFKRPDVDSLPFAVNFPGAPVAGMFGHGEIGRGELLGVKKDEQLPSSCIHAYSSVYLAMSYVPAPTSLMEEN